MTALIISGLLCESDDCLAYLGKYCLPSASRDEPFGSEIFKLYEDIFNSFGVKAHPCISTQSLEPGEEWIERGNQVINKFSGTQSWCWTDSRTTLLLDYWLKLEPQINYLLVYQPPWIALNQLFKESTREIQDEPELAMNLWMVHNRSILNFYNTHRDQCLLLNAYFLDQQFDELVVALSDKFGFTFQLSQAKADTVKKSSNLPLQLYSQALGHTAPEAIELYLEMESCADMLGREPDFNCQEVLYTTFTKSELLQNWSSFGSYESSRELHRIELVKRLEQSASECKSLLQKLSAVERSNKQLNIELSDTNKQHNIELSDSNKVLEEMSDQLKILENNNRELLESEISLKERYKGVEQESELCLLQLHQVQEELEHYFFLNQENENLANNSNINLANANKRIQDIEKLLNEYHSAMITAEINISKLYKSKLNYAE